MRITAIVNQKGGCGKTTTAINLAAIYARRGLRTLLVDVDPQAHCAAGLGVPEERVEYSIGDAMLAPERLDASRLLWEVARNLHLAPSTMRLAAIEAPGGGLHECPQRDRRLGTVLRHLAHRYDRCFIDCPPTIGLLTFNAMRAAREVLVPVETGYFALKGAERQWETIQRVIRRIGRPIASHIVATLHDPDSARARDILHALRRRFAGQIVPVVIHEHEALREAASMGQAIVEFGPDTAARRDYEDLAVWLEAHQVAPIPEIEVVEPDSRALETGAPSPRVAETPSRRAAELVERLRADITGPPRSPSMPASPAGAEALPRGAVGVELTPLGVRFVQPVDGRSVALVGAFNGWNSALTPLLPNTRLGVVERLMHLPAGRHEYALVIDGVWQADPHNADRIPGPDGREMSFIDVPPPLSITPQTVPTQAVDDLS